MKKLIPFLIVALLFLAVAVSAAIVIPAADQAKDNAKGPEKSPAISDNWGLTPPGLEKIEFIHYKDGKVKVVGGAAKAPTCYKFITPTKVRWKVLPVSYVINPTNSQALDENFIASAVFNSAETWDARTSKELMNDAYTVDYSASYGVQNYANSIVFGNYPTTGVIAVTSVWYNPATKAIVEFDIMFDTDWTWGDATVNPTVMVMDLQNIATHELGHGVGLGDVYDSACSEVTMYGYSDYGEFKKRTLEQPDITGLQTLYGS